MRVFPLSSVPPKPLVRHGKRTTQPRAARRIARTLATLPIALASLLIVAAAASAAGTATVTATGLTEPSGAIVDPENHVWVSDGSGFCETTATDPPSAGPGTITPACDTTVSGQPAETANRQFVLIPDGKRGTSIHRLKWDAGRDSYFADGEIPVGHPIPAGVGIGPDGAAYVIFTRLANVERIPNAVSAPTGSRTDQEIGTVAGGARGAAAIAVGLDEAGANTAVYLAENKAGGVSELVQPTGPGDVATPTPFGAATLGATPPAFGALVYEPTNHTLFGATALGVVNAFPDTLSSMDVLNRHIQDDAVAGGYGNVGGIGLGGAGRILAVDDPSTTGFAGAGRLLSTLVPDTTAPITTIDSPSEGAVTSASPSFAFRTGEAASFACRLDTGAFASCSSPLSLSGLAPGGHTLDVQATDPAGNVGPVATRHFTVAAPAAPPPGTAATPAGRIPGAGVLGATSRSAPRLTLSLRLGRARLHGTAIALPVRCNVTCVAQARGTISVRGSARLYRLRGASRLLRGGQSGTLVVHVPRSALGSIHRALHAGRTVSMRVALRTEDVAGNATTRTTSVRVRGA